MNQIYLDHNSTTPIHPEVAATMMQCFEEGYVNPASQHQLGQKARRVIEQHRVAIANRLGATTTGMRTDQLLFTSGGTESNNLALIGLAMASLQSRQQKDPDAKPGLVLISSVEHPSIIGAGEQLARLGFDVRKLPVGQDGLVDIEAYSELIHNELVDVVSIMLANNETGIIQCSGSEKNSLLRIHSITSDVQGENLDLGLSLPLPLIHTDAVQAIGKIPVEFRRLCVDAMTFTAHKFSGPRGIGGLLLRNGISIQPTLFGGFQQMGLRPGTEDVALVAGMARALELFDENPDEMNRVGEMRDFLENELIQTVAGTHVVGRDSMRVPQTLNVSFDGVNRQELLMAADMAGLAISTGSACASGSSEPSPVLTAMGLSKEVIEGSIRISLGVSNTQSEIVDSASRISMIINNLR